MSFLRLRPASAVAAASAAALSIYTVPRMLPTAHAESPTKKVFPSLGPAFFSLPLESAELVSHDTKRLRFKLPDDGVTGLPLTSSVLTFSWPKGKLLPVLRPYTPITHSDDKGHMDLLVKHYPSGAQSTYLHSLNPSDSLFFAAVLPGPRWTPNQHEHITLIAGGAGITPCFQLLQGILFNPEDKTRCTLVVGVNTEKDVLLEEEFRKLETRFPGRLRRVTTVSRPESGNGKYRKGYITRELLDEVTEKNKDTRVFVCGPPSMEEALTGSRSAPGILEQVGFKKNQIQKF